MRHSCGAQVENNKSKTDISVPKIFKDSKNVSLIAENLNKSISGKSAMNSASVQNRSVMDPLADKSDIKVFARIRPLLTKGKFTDAKMLTSNSDMGVSKDPNIGEVNQNEKLMSSGKKGTVLQKKDKSACANI